MAAPATATAATTGAAGANAAELGVGVGVAEPAGLVAEAEPPEAAAVPDDEPAGAGLPVAGGDDGWEGFEAPGLRHSSDEPAWTWGQLCPGERAHGDGGRVGNVAVLVDNLEGQVSAADDVSVPGVLHDVEVGVEVLEGLSTGLATGDDRAGRSVVCLVFVLAVLGMLGSVRASKGGRGAGAGGGLRSHPVEFALFRRKHQGCVSGGGRALSCPGKLTMTGRPVLATPAPPVWTVPRVFVRADPLPTPADRPRPPPASASASLTGCTGAGHQSTRL